MAGVLVEDLEQANENKMVAGQKTVCLDHIRSNSSGPRHVGGGKCGKADTLSEPVKVKSL